VQGFDRFDAQKAGAARLMQRRRVAYMVCRNMRTAIMSDAHAIARHHRAIRRWLLVVAALIFVMVLVGGMTRLTESGLSIVEWQPVTGTLPPLSQVEWQVEFEKYQTIPQYRERNLGMSLQAFKTIYWWEWTHRFLGRLIGAVFLLPFLFFLWRGWIEPGLRARLWAIFGLGALQGAVGWWMVMSGLSARVSVAHGRLAFHLTLACIIYAAILWTVQRLRANEPQAVPARIRASAMTLLILVLVQIFAGALVAGLHGGLVYNNWPLMDGALVPATERLLFLTPAWSNFFDNVLTVQFQHRIVAYVLWLLSIAHVVDVALQRSKGTFPRALVLAAAITIQAALGILTLINSAPLTLALLHQAMAMVVLTVAALHAERLVSPKRELRRVVLTSVSHS
jgi:cytochrome c oxidase assembly protein subunit 15